MDKGDLRGMLRSVPGPSAEVASRVVMGLFQWMSGRLPGTVSAYLPMKDEIDVTHLFQALPGWRWVLPRVEADASLTFRDRDVPREMHRWGMEQPSDTGRVVPVHELDMILVPGLAFDETGARLGRGGGYYDRLLGDRRGDCPAVGVTWNQRVVEGIPVDEHDRSVDFLATEDGVVPSRAKR